MPDHPRYQIRHVPGKTLPWHVVDTWDNNRIVSEQLSNYQAQLSRDTLTNRVGSHGVYGADADYSRRI